MNNKRNTRAMSNLPCVMDGFLLCFMNRSDSLDPFFSNSPLAFVWHNVEIGSHSTCSLNQCGRGFPASGFPTAFIADLKLQIYSPVLVKLVFRALPAGGLDHLLS